MRCIYCGLDAGDYDEHEECVEASLVQAVECPDDDTSLDAAHPSGHYVPMTTAQQPTAKQIAALNTLFAQRAVTTDTVEALRAHALQSRGDCSSVILMLQRMDRKTW